MNKKLPLPDIPVFEYYRQLDESTKVYDSENNRPVNYWRDMPQKSLRKLDRRMHYEFDRVEQVILGDGVQQIPEWKYYSGILELNQ